MATLAKLPKFKPLDCAGNPYPSYRLFSYEAGTSTPLVTYQDKDNTPNTNPVILDACGEADVWLKGAYKFVLKPPAEFVDQTPIWTVDNIEEYDQLDWTGLTATIEMLNATDTSTKTLVENYDVLLTDRGKTLLCDSTATPFYVQLTEATASKNGFIITIKKITTSANAITVKPYSGQTIEGLDELLITNNNESVTLICDGSNWLIIEENIKIRIYPTINNNSEGDLTSILAFPARQFFRVLPTTSEIEVKLPSLANVGNGFEMTFKKSGTSTETVRIIPFGTDEIDDLNQDIFLHANGESITLLSTTASWYKTGDSAGVTSEPLGSFILTSAPATDQLPHYMVPDGRAISRTEYADYFALVGTEYGIGNGTTTFNIPNLNGRVIVGTTAEASEKSVTSLTRTDTVATVTAATHGYTGNAYVTISGANPSDYNGTWRIKNVTSDTFDFYIYGNPATPATGTIKAKAPPSATGSYFYLGQTGGEFVHVQQLEEIRNHKHQSLRYGLTKHKDGEGDGGVWDSDATHPDIYFDTSSTGSSREFNILQPLLGCRLLLKVK
jgi:microcystin-dependent protein